MLSAKHSRKERTQQALQSVGVSLLLLYTASDVYGSHQNPLTWKFLTKYSGTSIPREDRGQVEVATPLPGVRKDRIVRGKPHWTERSRRGRKERHISRLGKKTRGSRTWKKERYLSSLTLPFSRTPRLNLPSATHGEWVSIGLIGSAEFYYFRSSRVNQPDTDTSFGGSGSTRGTGSFPGSGHTSDRGRGYSRENSQRSGGNESRGEQSVRKPLWWEGTFRREGDPYTAPRGGNPKGRGSRRPGKR